MVVAGSLATGAVVPDAPALPRVRNLIRSGGGIRARRGPANSKLRDTVSVCGVVQPVFDAVIGEPSNRVGRGVCNFVNYRYSRWKQIFDGGHRCRQHSPGGQ